MLRLTPATSSWSTLAKCTTACPWGVACANGECCILIPPRDEFVEAEGVTGIEVIRPAVSDRLLATCFGALFASVIDTEPDLLLLEENLLRLIMHISRCHALRPSPGREPSPSVKKALARLDGDPASAIRLTELAGLAGISRYQLLRAFVREVGATPHAYLVQRRIYLARRLLAAGRPIVEAAMDAGFADQSHLT
jgi:AraC-like DNA-binding protein